MNRLLFTSFRTNARHNPNFTQTRSAIVDKRDIFCDKPDVRDTEGKVINSFYSPTTTTKIKITKSTKIALIKTTPKAATLNHKNVNVGNPAMQLDKHAADLEHKVVILTRLSEISAVLNSTLRVKPLLNQIMAAAVEIVEAEAASVLLWDHKHERSAFRGDDHRVERAVAGGDARPAGRQYRRDGAAREPDGNRSPMPTPTSVTTAVSTRRPSFTPARFWACRCVRATA